MIKTFLSECLFKHKYYIYIYIYFWPILSIFSRSTIGCLNVNSVLVYILKTLVEFKWKQVNEVVYV